MNVEPLVIKTDIISTNCCYTLVLDNMYYLFPEKKPGKAKNCTKWGGNVILTKNHICEKITTLRKNLDQFQIYGVSGESCKVKLHEPRTKCTTYISKQ